MPRNSPPAGPHGSGVRLPVHGIARMWLAAGVLLIGLAFVWEPALAQSPSPGTPAPQPTPWPPPVNLGVKGGCQITNADGSFIPPAERQCGLMVVWAHLSGFTGSYEVELQIQPWDPPPGPFERVATVPATAIVNGEGRFDDSFGFLDAMGTVRCYRVRTVVNGETGPYTNPVCESFAGVVDGGVPRPPDTGMGKARGESGTSTSLVTGVLILLSGGIAAGFVAWRRRPAR